MQTGWRVTVVCVKIVCGAKSQYASILFRFIPTPQQMGGLTKNPLASLAALGLAGMAPANTNLNPTGKSGRRRRRRLLAKCLLLIPPFFGAQRWQRWPARSCAPATRIAASSRRPIRSSRR